MKQRRSKLLVMIAGVMFLALTATTVTAQDLVVSGTVTSQDDNEPLAGVSIQVEGTYRGTVTDADGNYELSVDEDDPQVLVFSYVGFVTREIAIEGRETINVEMEPDIGMMDDVVIVGYSSRTQRDLSSSIATMSTEDLQQTVTSSDSFEKLQGRIPGMEVTRASGQPGAATEVRIRGRGSITADSGPLVVVDGVIGTSGQVNPNDIESISVLKDADATALYGSRAANGVVLITTKSGQSGELDINIRSSLGFNQRNTGNFSVMNSQELANLQQGVRDIEDEWLQTDTDWQDLVYQRGLTQQYDVSVSSGTERTTYYLSGGYFHEEGTIRMSDFERYTLRANVSHNVTDDFRVTTNLSGRIESSSENPDTYVERQALANMPWDRPYSEDGELRTGLESDWIGRDMENFLVPMQYNRNIGGTQNYDGMVRLQYNIAPWLEFRSTNSASFVYTEGEEFNDQRTQAGAEYDGNLYQSEGFYRNLTTSNILEGERSLDDHSLNALVGFEYEEAYSENMSGLAVGAPPGLSVFEVMASARNLNGNKSEDAFIAGLFQANYGYMDRYFVNASFRRDGSSRFGEDNRFGNFYSIGAGWLASAESFMAGFDAIDLLKFRASYGTTGNAEIGSYQARGVYGYTQSYNYRVGGIPERLPAPNLTWEVAHATNFGIELTLWERLEMELDLYNINNKDLLQEVPIEATTGFTTQIDNIGDVNNRGFEFTMRTRNLVGEFSWITDFNIGRNRNEVTRLFDGEAMVIDDKRIEEGEDIRTWYLREWAGVDPETGTPLWEKVIEDEDGNVTGIELTGDYDEATRQKVGSATPDFTGGISNTFIYRNFTLFAHVNFVQGKDVYHSAREGYDHDGAYINRNYMNIEDHGWRRWEGPGDEGATHPEFRMGGNNNSQRPSSRYLEDGSYIRLQNVRLSYELPADLTQQIGAKRLSLSVEANNVWTSTDFSGMDPETDLDGVIWWQYPVPRSLVFGLQLNL